jgi:alpha-2-macroglobulin
VASSLGGGMAGIRVEEYKRPSFEVTLKEQKELLRLNRPATVAGEARYYFGLPVAHGEVRWRVHRSPQYWWWSYSWWGYAPEVRAQTVAAGRSPIADDGSFTIAFTPVADERRASKGKEAIRPSSWSYEVSVDAVDEGGETHSASRTFRLGFVSVEAHVDAQPGFFREKTPAKLTIVRTDLDGAPRAGNGSWTVTRLEQPAAPLLPADEPRSNPPRLGSGVQTPGDLLRARWETDYDPRRTLAGWKDGPEVARGETAHDAKGKGTAEIPALPAGAYRLRYRTTDDTGGVFEMPVEIFVAGPKTPAALPAVLKEYESTVPVGGTASFLAASGFAGQPMTFEKYRMGRLVERRELVGGRSAALVEMPVGEADRGGFAVRLTLVRDHQLVTLNSAVLVPWDDKELVVSYATFRDKLKPGATEAWRVKVAPRAKDGRAEAGAAELLAYMYDRSLDTFAPHSPASVLGLYPNGMYADGVRAHLGQTYFQYLSGSFPSVFTYTPPHGDGLKIPSGYPIGGLGRRGGSLSYAGEARMAAVTVNAEAPMMDELKAAAPAPSRAESGSALPASAPALLSKTAAVGGIAGAGAGGAVELRSNFAETAFWKPALRTDAEGAASIEFTVPDSVTAWRVWVHAVTKEMKGGSASNDARSVKDLMVRPYVPRFLREGDRAELQVVVDNATDKPLSGTVEIDVLDAETNASALADFGLTKEKARLPFTAAAGRGAHVPFSIAAPSRARLYAVRATAVSGTISDGELRPVPVLPGRMSLAQSRFVALAGNDSRTMTFEDLAKNDDPTRVDQQLVVTVDAQLFDSVLQALPYLAHYPYECTEQTLNRFVSTSIVEAVFRDNPSVAKMAASMAKRSSRLQPWDESDPNRRMALEETPWLQQARGGADAGLELARILNPEVAKAERDAAIEKLRKAQTPEGGFPWWPGGPPSPYMTVYILHGFANALELGADVPRDIVEKAWGYAGSQLRHDLDQCMHSIHFCSLVTFVNYTLSSYPDPSWYKNAFDEKYREVLLAYSFAHWKVHSPYLKSQLALTLVRMKRPEDAKLVWSSVMDSAKTDRDLGTYWAPEDRAWLWYNDTIETQAMALRALMEVDPADSRRHGLVQWLFLNKKLNQWKSTRATAEVIASLVRYLKKESLLGIREEAAVSVGGQRTTFVFEPEKYTGAKNQVVVPGEKIDPARDSKVTVEKLTKGMSFASATWSFTTEKLPAEDRGDFFGVSRRYFRREPTTSGFVLKPLAEGVQVALGDEIEVQVSLTAKHEAEYVHLRDPRPAGTEPVRQTSGYRWDLGIGRYEEVRDSGQNFFFEQLPVGQYTMKYRLRAATAGTFKVAPATVQSMYAPEFHAYSAGNTITIGAGAR